MLNSGQILQERYRIISQLGQGGMGAVYHAWDTRLSIPVALKEMIPQSDLDSQVLGQLRDQFQKEAETLARLNHPHLVGVTDFFEEGRNVYLVMKYVEGESLANRIQNEGALSEELVVAWSAQLLDALGYCHNQGVIHRDIKPQNIIIRPDGDAILVDFGLVKLWDPNDPKTRTAVRGVGTPQYAPPEQYELDSGHTEPRSDLYSLGATMYHALTGQAPPTATMRIAAPEDFVPIREVIPNIGDATATTIERAMELARSRRWASVMEMATSLGVAIRDWGGTLSTQSPAGLGSTVVMSKPALREEPRRAMPKWVWGVIAACVLLLIGGGGWLLSQRLTSQAHGVTTVTATSDRKAVFTETATPTLTLTSTSTPTPAETATPEPTETPTPSPTASPTLSPTVTPTEASTETPTLTPTPEQATEVPTTSPAAASILGNLITFETWGTWRRGDQPYGELSQTQEQVKSGSYAARLDYNYTGSTADNDYVVFVQSRNMSGQPTTLSAWVYGDGSGHYLNLWVMDANNELWAVYLGRVGGAGWQKMSGQLGDTTWPAGHVDGPSNGVVDYPVRFDAIVLDRPGQGALQGKIYLDDIAMGQGSVATPVPTSAPAATVPPTTAPSSGGAIGQIVFTAKIGDAFYLYSTDLGAGGMSQIGLTDYGHSTCAGGSTAATIDGQVISLYGMNICGITERTDACTSPNGAYRVITNFVKGVGWTVNLENMADGSSKWYYQGDLSRSMGIQWAPSSLYAMFGIQTTAYVIPADGQDLKQVITFMDTSWSPQFSPDGAYIYYLKPVGNEGASDVFIVNADGSGDRNLTNSPFAHKSCPRWRR